MSRNFEAELDSLKSEVLELKEVIASFISSKSGEGVKTAAKGKVQKMTNMHPNPHIMGILDRLENVCDAGDDTGAITYVGVFTSSGRQSTWVRNEVSANSLLSLIENRSAESVLSCIGSSDKLNILLAVLRKPMTVAQLVEVLGYNTTGQVYHHLKPLISANLITENENERGVYCVVSHRVQGIIMLLAGISDMLDPSFTQGTWE